MHSELQAVGILVYWIIGFGLATTMAELEASHQMQECDVGQGYSSSPLVCCGFTTARSPSSVEKHFQFLLIKTLSAQPSLNVNNLVFIGLLVRTRPMVPENVDLSRQDLEARFT